MVDSKRSPKPAADPARESGTVPRPDVEVDGRPLALRNTIPATSSTKEPMNEEPATGQRPRLPSERGSKPAREAIRVDQLGSKRPSIRGPVEVRPRIVDASRVGSAPLDARHAFVLQLIEGRFTMSELADVSGMALEDIERIVTRLTRLGIVAV